VSLEAHCSRAPAVGFSHAQVIQYAPGLLDTPTLLARRRNLKDSRQSNVFVLFPDRMREKIE
jgi:hypothetical protein